MRAAFVRGEGEGALHDDATWLLDFYETFKDFVAADVTETALTSLAKVDGRFGARPRVPFKCTHPLTRWSHSRPPNQKKKPKLYS